MRRVRKALQNPINNVRGNYDTRKPDETVAQRCVSVQRPVAMCYFQPLAGAPHTSRRGMSKSRPLIKHAGRPTQGVIPLLGRKPALDFWPGTRFACYVIRRVYLNRLTSLITCARTRATRRFFGTEATGKRCVSRVMIAKRPRKTAHGVVRLSRNNPQKRTKR